MPFIPASQAARFNLPGVEFLALAAPSRGATENAVWIVTLAPGTPGNPHTLTREEVLVGIEGEAVATLAGERHALTAGSAIVIPPGVPFSLANESQAPFRAVAVLPVGAQAELPGQAPFTPPWAV